MALWQWTGSTRRFSAKSKALGAEWRGDGRLMLWEVEITPRTADREESRVRHEYRLLTNQDPPHAFVERTSRGFLLEGDLTQSQVDSLVSGVLLDPLVESAQVRHAKLGQFAPSGFQVGARQGPCMGLGECVQGVVV